LCDKVLDASAKLEEFDKTEGILDYRRRNSTRYKTTRAQLRHALYSAIEQLHAKCITVPKNNQNNP
jgi:hypothetical protein